MSFEREQEEYHLKDPYSLEHLKKECSMFPTIPIVIDKFRRQTKSLSIKVDMTVNGEGYSVYIFPSLDSMEVWIEKPKTNLNMFYFTVNHETAYEYMMREIFEYQGLDLEFLMLRKENDRS